MKRVLSISTLYPNPVKPRFGTFVARSLEALAKREDWDVTVINPIGLPPVLFGDYRELATAAVDGKEHGVHVYRPTFRLIPKLGGRLNPGAIARAVIPLAKKLQGCGVFGISGEELLCYAVANRTEWESKGGSVIETYLESYEEGGGDKAGS